MIFGRRAGLKLLPVSYSVILFVTAEWKKTGEPVRSQTKEIIIAEARLYYIFWDFWKSTRCDLLNFAKQIIVMATLRVVGFTVHTCLSFFAWALIVSVPKHGRIGLKSSLQNVHAVIECKILAPDLLTPQAIALTGSVFLVGAGYVNETFSEIRVIREC